MNLRLQESLTHPSLDLDTPLPALPPLDASSSKAIESFIRHGLPYCGHLTPVRVLHMFDRYRTSASSMSPDQAALVYSCLACGYARTTYFNEHTKAARQVPESDRQDVAWYRQAVESLTIWGSATFTSLRKFMPRSGKANSKFRCFVLPVVLHDADLYEWCHRLYCHLDDRSSKGAGSASRTDRSSYPTFTD